jgi:hypothetical protein
MINHPLQVTCRRCARIAEQPTVLKGRVPNGKGKMVKCREVLLCLDCIELMVVSPREFWGNGWEQPDGA